MISTRRASGRSHRLLAMAGALAALLIQTQGVAAANTAGSWTISASPTAIVAGSSDKVRLTITNTSSSSGGNKIGCVRVTIPGTFTVGTPSFVSVSIGPDWLATKSGHTVTAKGGDQLREDPDDDSLVLDVPVSAGLIAGGPWTFHAYEKVTCTTGSFPVQSILITIIVSPTPKPTPKPTPSPKPTPKPKPSPTAAPTPGPTSAATAGPTADPSPTDRPGADPSASPDPRSSSAPVATAVPKATPGIGLGGPPGPAGPPPDGDHFADVISIPVDEADPSFAGLGTDMLATLGVFAWAVPGALLAAPGLLLILVIVAQSLGALAWLPIVRRRIGDFGLTHRLTPPHGPA